MLSPLNYLSARTDGAVNGGRSPFILTVDCSVWLCYLLDFFEFKIPEMPDKIIPIAIAISTIFFSVLVWLTKINV